MLRPPPTPPLPYISAFSDWSPLSKLVRLDVVAFAEDDSEGEDDIAEPGGEGWGQDDGVALFSRDRSLKLRAQFLRALACRAGVLGGVFARAGSLAVSPEKRDDTCSAMDVEDDEGGEQEGGGRGKGKQGRAPDGATGAAVYGHVTRRLEEIATRLVQSCDLLSRNDRGLACRALAQLWLALAGPGQSDNLSCLVSVSLVACLVVDAHAQQMSPQDSRVLSACAC